MPTDLIDRDEKAGGSEPSVELHSVSVRFRVPSESIRSFKEYILRRLRGGIRYRNLWALRDIELAIPTGEFFGIVGHNGAGKSTLLKVISRILRPTAGRVVVRGRVAPLLELNAGFHPDMTGIENVFLNAGILGYPPEVVEPEIQRVIEFAELEEFIHLPIRNYSTGMVTRLGFSVASMFRPEVLILDEVMAVGDQVFQEKSLERIRQFCALGTTVLVVSHSLDQVEEHCSSIAWMEKGELLGVGPTTEILDQYKRSLSEERRLVGAGS